MNADHARRCPCAPGGRHPRTTRRIGVWLGALAVVALTTGCEWLFDEDADSHVSEDFIRGNWRIESIRLVDGLTLGPGQNQAAGMPGVVWTVAGSARFADGRADIEYSVTVTGMEPSPIVMAYAFNGSFDVDENTLSIIQDGSGAEVQLIVRKDHAAVMIGEREVDNFGLFDGDGNEVLWIRG